MIKTGEPVMAKEEKETWPDGRVTWGSHHQAAASTPGGIIGTFGVSRDITLKQTAETALQASSCVTRPPFETNVAAIIRNTLDGRIVDCNAAAAHILGYESARKMLGVNMRELRWDREQREELLTRLQAGESLAGIEFKFRHKTGNPVWAIVNTSASPRDETSETFIQDQSTSLNASWRKK